MTRRRGEQGTDWTGRYHRDEHDANDAHPVERFSNRSKYAQRMKMQRTAKQRASDSQIAADVVNLPIGEVIQVHSLFVELICQGEIYLCVQRRTMQKLARTQLVVGDQVRFQKLGTIHESGKPEAAIEQVLPRQTVLMRQNSFRKELPSPIVANAQQMLIVTSILRPNVKWGLVDRMLIAAESGSLRPIVCLNKIDLADEEVLAEANAVLEHYRKLGIRALATSSETGAGVGELKAALTDSKTVLAGHSGVGKSSLIRSIAPELDIRVGEVSEFNEKGMHTTTSARRYQLPFGGEVIDTPGVRHFGLVDVTPETLIGFFPDVEDGSAPAWRSESYERILASL